MLELGARAHRGQQPGASLGPTALALFKRLAATDAVVSKRELAACLPDGGDEHALDVAVSRYDGPWGHPD